MEEYQDYKIIAAKGSDKLSEKINEEMDAGYVPFGSHNVSTTYIGDNEDGSPKMFILFSQALVLPFDTEVEYAPELDEVYPAIKE